MVFESARSSYPLGGMSQQPQTSLSATITSLPPSLQNLLRKQQEYAGLQALREASAELLARVETLAEMSNVMADGGEGASSTDVPEGTSLTSSFSAVGAVLRNWPHVFSILNLFGEKLSAIEG